MRQRGKVYIKRVFRIGELVLIGMILMVFVVKNLISVIEPIEYVGFFRFNFKDGCYVAEIIRLWGLWVRKEKWCKAFYLCCLITIIKLIIIDALEKLVN